MIVLNTAPTTEGPDYALYCLLLSTWIDIKLPKMLTYIQEEDLIATCYV